MNFDWLTGGGRTDDNRGRGGAQPLVSAEQLPPEAFDEQTLLAFSGAPRGDHWRVKDAYEGTQIFGATGSGKTSGSGFAIAEKLLKAGFGGLVLTAKPDEYETWQRYAAATGRSADLIRFAPDEGRTFNFLAYEQRFAKKRQNVASRPGEAGAPSPAPSADAGLTENVVNLFSAVLESAERSGGNLGGDPFWRRATKQLLRNAVEILVHSGEALTLANINEIIQTAPQTLAEAESESWSARSGCFAVLSAALENTEEGSSQRRDVEVSERYWLREFASLADKTRSSIVTTFTSMADVFLRGGLREIFSPLNETKESYTPPDLSHKGAIIVLDMPIKTYNEFGTFAQAAYKFLWQRAAERRKPKADGQRPVFLWVDEAQYFVSSYDMQFQTTARSSRVATVYLTQNISNYYAILPGDRGRAETDSLLANFQTKIFHANGDSVTNGWAAELIAKNWDWRENRSSSISSPQSAARGSRSGTQFSTSEHQHLEYQVLPLEFTVLRKGGKDNDRLVEGIVFQGGREWSDGRNYAFVEFMQPL